MPWRRQPVPDVDADLMLRLYRDITGEEPDAVTSGWLMAAYGAQRMCGPKYILLVNVRCEACDGTGTGGHELVAETKTEIWCELRPCAECGGIGVLDPARDTAPEQLAMWRTEARERRRSSGSAFVTA